MKEEISFNVFRDRFRSVRPLNFTYDGLRALFDYLEQYEEETGQDLELDVIALCCEYSEYESLNEYLKDYNTDIEKTDYTEEDGTFNEEKFKEAVLNEIMDKTTFIKINDDSFIIGCY